MLLLVALEARAQPPFKTQVRLNVISLPDFYYAGAIRFGVETLNRRYNWGIDYLAFTMADQIKSTYSRDSFFRCYTDNKREWIGGFGINCMSTYKFKNNCNQLVAGIQGFIGWQVQTNTITNALLDTPAYRNPSVYTPPAYGWQITQQDPVVIAHGEKLVLGITPFIRFQLMLSKRFTFNPELMLPVYFRNQIGGDMTAEFTPGFNFCVGYRFRRSG